MSYVTFGWACSYFTSVDNSVDGLINTCVDLLYFYVTTNFLIYYRLFEASNKEIVIEYNSVLSSQLMVLSISDTLQSVSDETVP